MAANLAVNERAKNKDIETEGEKLNTRLVQQLAGILCP